MRALALGASLAAVLAATGPAAATPGGPFAALSDTGAPRQLPPLDPGGARNPISAADAAGQRALLARLRCGDGGAPRARFVSNIGLGVRGSMVALWDIACRGAPGRVALHLDTAAGPGPAAVPPGFTLAAD